ncbi:hypothetical protein [Paucisalibacillus globulus]|uniref:hypothetical protein n=1 Tax=Paucisalibacillus globulus TaxID=351095 RepID=UPI000BB99590|nr:hypothetical protein [Paucisalibacillus globulus]
MHNNVKDSIDSIIGSDPIFTTESQRKVLSIKCNTRKKKSPSYFRLMPTLLGVVTTILIAFILLVNITNDNRETAESPENPSTNNEPGSSVKLPESDSSTKNESNFIQENKDLIEEYAAIIKIFQGYELPTEGIVKEELNVLYYENGYQFHVPTKQFIGVGYDPEIGQSEPTEDQILGVILGHVANLKAEIDLESYQWDRLGFIELELEHLYEVKKYSDNYNSIEEWVDKTINYLEESKALLNSDKEEAYQLFNNVLNLISDFHTATELANVASLEVPETEKGIVLSQDEIEELAKTNPNVLPAPEFYSVDEFIAQYVIFLNRENKELLESTDKYTYEQHIVTTANGYAKHFLELTDSKNEQKKLEKIVEITDVVFEKMRVSELDDLTLENSFNELRTTMNHYFEMINKSQ